MWLFIRRQLMEEMDDNRDRWRPILNSVDRSFYDSLYTTLDWSGVGSAPNIHWMEMPATGLLIAQKFGVVVQFLSSGGHSETYFPMFDGPGNIEDHAFISFAWVNKNHYIALELAKGAPMPRLNRTWSEFRYEQASEWETIYENRIERVHRRREYVDLT